MSARPRIGILTFHRCINYGSYWQARCLVEGLRARGHDAVLLDHESRAVTWAEWRCALRPMLPDPTPAADRRAYAAKARLFLDAFEALPQSPRFALDDPAAVPPCDIAIVGSDEVWNLRHPWYGGKGLFWGAGLERARAISYAASFGNHDAHEGLDAGRQAMLRGFAAISVRDENGRRLVSAAIGHDPAMVLDPCLLFPPMADPVRGEAPYAVVYGHGFPDWYARQLRRWAGARGHRLVSIGYRNDWADEQRIAIGPEEFARLMAGAQAVATNFFHGCVFALLNGRPFAAAVTPYRLNKVRDLTAALGAERHLVTPETSLVELADLLDRPLAPAIGAAIARMRASSLAWLDRAIAG